MAAMAAASLVPVAAAAYSTAPGYVARDYATGFPTAPPDAHGLVKGPIGLAFDQSDRLFVFDIADGNLYSFPPGGGQAAAHRVSTSPIPGSPSGAAVTSDGRLYVARFKANDVVEVSPATGSVLRVVATGINCATGLTVDPVSGDLFVSQNLCGNTIFRISNFHTGPGSVSSYVQLPAADGIGFGNDGTLYVESQSNIMAVSGTSTPHPGTATQIGHVPQADGLAFGLPHGSTNLPFLVTNRLDGVTTRVDFNGSSTTNTDIFSGGSRGDFVAVDSHGCLYTTQSDRVVRFNAADNTCNFNPSNLTQTTPGSRGLVLSQLLVGCSGRKLVLVNVARKGRTVQLLGAADQSLIGRTVSIVFGPAHTAVATAVVGPDGFFHAMAPLPSRKIRNTNRARYQAQLGSESSLNLKLFRRMLVRSVTAANGKVTITGRVIPPLAKRRGRIAIQRQLTCTKYTTVRRVKARANGRFKATLPAPANSQVAVYRATTKVRKSRRTRRASRTFTLPILVQF